MSPMVMCVCVLVFVWELSFGLGLKWAFTPLGPLRVLFKGARTSPKPREVCNRHFENLRSTVVFFSLARRVGRERRGGGP